MEILQKNKAHELSEFDMASYLSSKKAMTEYLNQVIAEEDATELAAALGHIARAKND